MTIRRLKPRRPGLLASALNLLFSLGLRSIGEKPDARRARLDRKAEVEQNAKRRL